MNAFVQRTEVSQTGSAFAAPTGWNWNYDSLGQVTTAEHATTPANHRAYAYDAIGNRLQGSTGVPPASGTIAYTTNSTNQQHQPTAPTNTPPSAPYRPSTTPRAT